ncbi:MAG: FAD-dependent oxidoreductase [Lentisphaeria bacterium]|nr:FAD-dependent oxidoreductase [Lentisphaeria bacterium]
MNLQNIPYHGEYDVLVCGSGMGGITAACAASEMGLKVGMIEYFGEPGGIPVNGRLGSISGFAKGDQVAVSGFARKFADTLNSRGKACVQGGGSNINLPPADIAKLVWELIDCYQIDLRCYTQLVDVIKADDGTITEAIVCGKAGLQRVKAKFFIDATGDGDAAALAGCPVAVGRESDGKVQSATLVFIIGGIDLEKLPAYMDVRKVWKSKERPVPINHSVYQFVPHGGKTNEIAVNMTHALNADPLTSEGLTAIRRECMKQADYLLNEFFRKEIPGFENAWIAQFAPQVGIRESRRIVGDYTLSTDDVLSARHFDDEIAQGIWSIDVHNPDGIHTGCSQYLTAPYGIPYRCITPQGVKNLLIAGRPISADHVAHSSSRINASCMAVGEAAGFAAALAIASKDIRKIDVKKVQELLKNAEYKCFQ